MSQSNVLGSRETPCPDSEVLLTKTTDPRCDKYSSTTECDGEASIYADRITPAATLYNQHAKCTTGSEFRGSASSLGLAQQPKSATRVWGYIIFPLAAHFCLSIGILCTILFGINDHVFNITDRTPTVTLLNGTTVEVEGITFTLLQSDITTILSLLLAILRLFSTAWCGALCWRIALILMEKSGMTIRELNWLASFGIPPIVFPSFRRQSGGGYMLGLGIISIFILPVPLGAPLITGSITWTPASINYPAQNMSILARGWDVYDNSSRYQRAYGADIPAIDIMSSAIRGFQAWGSSNETDIMRRTLNTLNLPVNTTLNNITVPYFKITRFEWLKDPESLLTPRQLGVIDPDNSTYWLNISTDANPMFNTLGYNAALIDDRDLSSPILEDWPIPHTALLVYFATQHLIPTVGSTQCRWHTDRYQTGLLFTHPPDATLVPRRKGMSRFCFAFANVTYTAGSANCRSCRISPSFATQGDTPLQVYSDHTTRYIMLVMAQVIHQIRLYQTLADLPQPRWNTLDQYITSQLQQTYSAIWSDLADSAGPDRWTKIALPVSVLRGLVNIKRVWAWFALQMIITISGVAFIVIQAHVDQCPIQNVSLAPLFIDTSGIDSNAGSLHKLVSNEGKGVLRLRRAQGELLARASYAHLDST